MPLLLCPNDNSAMQTVDRTGVQFDMCPACRGVWLDRGELEKLMAAGGDPDREPRGAQRPDPRWADVRDRDDRKEHRERGDYGHGYRKRGSIFDIFD